jgi:Spy/CpxP family protein refolding chaperone
MKILLAIIAALVLGATPVYAHCGKCGIGDEAKGPKGSGSGPAQAAEEKTAKLTAELGLTADQAAKIKPLIQEKLEKKKAIMAEAHDKKHALSEEYMAKIKFLLTPEQQSKYEAMMAEREKKGDDKEMEKEAGEHSHGAAE